VGIAGSLGSASRILGLEGDGLSGLLLLERCRIKCGSFLNDRNVSDTTDDRREEKRKLTSVSAMIAVVVMV
jgi:hypothetical protein